MTDFIKKIHNDFTTVGKLGKTIKWLVLADLGAKVVSVLLNYPQLWNPAVIADLNAINAALVLFTNLFNPKVPNV